MPQQELFIVAIQRRAGSANDKLLNWRELKILARILPIHIKNARVLVRSVV